MDFLCSVNTMLYKTIQGNITTWHFALEEYLIKIVLPCPWRLLVPFNNDILLNQREVTKPSAPMILTIYSG